MKRFVEWLSIHFPFSFSRYSVRFSKLKGIIDNDSKHIVLKDNHEISHRIIAALKEIYQKDDFNDIIQKLFGEYSDRIRTILHKNPNADITQNEELKRIVHEWLVSNQKYFLGYSSEIRNLYEELVASLLSDYYQQKIEIMKKIEPEKKFLEFFKKEYESLIELLNPDEKNQARSNYQTFYERALQILEASKGDGIEDMLVKIDKLRTDEEVTTKTSSKGRAYLDIQNILKKAKKDGATPEEALDAIRSNAAFQKLHLKNKEKQRNHKFITISKITYYIIAFFLVGVEMWLNTDMFKIFQESMQVVMLTALTTGLAILTTTHWIGAVFTQPFRSRIDNIIAGVSLTLLFLTVVGIAMVRHIKISGQYIDQNSGFNMIFFVFIQFIVVIAAILLSWASHNPMLDLEKKIKKTENNIAKLQSYEKIMKDKYIKQYKSISYSMELLYNAYSENNSVCKENMELNDVPAFLRETNH